MDVIAHEREEEYVTRTASGKKLFLSLVVLARMVCSHLPEVRGVNSPS